MQISNVMSAPTALSLSQAHQLTNYHEKSEFTDFSSHTTQIKKRPLEFQNINLYTFYAKLFFIRNPRMFYNTNKIIRGNVTLEITSSSTPSYIFS